MEVTASIFHAEVCMFSLMVFTRPSSWIPSEVTYWGIYNSLTVLHNILSLYNASWMLNTGVKKCRVLCTVSVCRVGWHSQSIWYCNYITCLYRFTYLKKKKKKPYRGTQDHQSKHHFSFSLLADLQHTVNIPPSEVSDDQWWLSSQMWIIFRTPSI